MREVWYGKTISWGSGASISVDGFDDPGEALYKAISMAEKSGWTNPRWFEFWRWGEERFERAELARLKAKYRE